MKVIEVSRPGGPEVLTLVERRQPVAGPGQVVVEVHAANINPTDLGARQGQTPPGVGDPPYVLGWDFAGVVTAVADDVDTSQVGDTVIGMIPWYQAGGSVGAYAEAVAVPASWVVPRPSQLPELDGATVPLNALTAAQALDLLAAPTGEPILVTGASGGVGSFFVQLAVQAGHPVTAVAGRDDDAWVAGLGADTVLARDTDLAGVGPFRYVLDGVPVGAALFPAVADGGRVVSTRPVGEEAPRGISQQTVRIEQDTARLDELVSEVAAGRLRTRVARTMPFSEAAAAHALVEAGGLHGKVLLVP